MNERQFQRIGSNELMRANRMNSNELKCALIGMNVIFKKGLQPQSYYRNIYLEEMNKRAERVSLQLSFENTVQLQNSPLSKSSSAKKITGSSAKKNNSSAQRSSSKDLSDLKHNNSFTAFSNNKMSSNKKNSIQPTGYLQQPPRTTLFDSILPDQNHNNNIPFVFPSPANLKNISQEKNIFQVNQEMISSTPWDNLLGNGFGNDNNQNLRLFEHQSSQKDHSGLSQRNTSASPSSEQIIQGLGQIKNVTTFETYSVMDDGDSKRNSNSNSRDNSISNGKRGVMEDCAIENDEIRMEDNILQGNNSRFSFGQNRKSKDELRNLVDFGNKYNNGIEEGDVNKMTNSFSEQKKIQGFQMAQGKENNSQISRNSSKISASKDTYQQFIQEKETNSLNLSQNNSQLQQLIPQAQFQGDYHQQLKKEQQHSLGSILSSISISEHAFLEEHIQEQKPLADAAFFDNQSRNMSFVSDRSNRDVNEKKVQEGESSSRTSKNSNYSTLTQQQRRYTNQFLGKSKNKQDVESFIPGNLQTIKKVLVLIVAILLISQVFKHLDLSISSEKGDQKNNKKQYYLEGQRNINDFIDRNDGLFGIDDDEMSSYWTARNELRPDIIIADLYNELKNEMKMSPNGLLSLDYIEQRLVDNFENDQHHVQLYLTKGEIYESLDSHNRAVFILKKKLN